VAKPKPFVQPTPWVHDSDELYISAWISVTQTMGTRAMVRVREHHLREDATEHQLASLTGDSKEQDVALLISHLRALLLLAEKRYKAIQEDENESN
jgi:hypothetical protein